MPKYNAEKSDQFKKWPVWVQEFAIKYKSKTANLYIVHGNIRDFLPKETKEGEFIFELINKYIAGIIFGNQDIIAYYDCSRGVSFCTEQMKSEYEDILGKNFPDDAGDFFSNNPEKSFPYLEKYFRMRIPKDRRAPSLRTVLIIDYAETIIPGGELLRLNDADRFCLVTLNRWANDPAFTEGDVSIILLTENLTDISPRLRSSSSTVKIAVSFPDENIRERFLDFKVKDRKGSLQLDQGLTPERVASVTSGLNLKNLDRLIEERVEQHKTIDMDYLTLKKKEMIEHEAAGLLEFMETQYTLDAISGHKFVIKKLRSHAKAINAGRTEAAPMGFLIAGPIGTGKSFMVSAFAREIGIPMVKFRNFRSKWQGESESNLEKVLHILKSMAPVAVMIDEADAYLGDRNQEGDSGTSNRIFAQIASFMGDTDYRGKIFWFLITCRPDLLPIDLKRQGRAEEHYALFYPETMDEKVALFKTLSEKLCKTSEYTKWTNNFSIPNLLRKCDYEISGADIESMLVRAMQEAGENNRSKVSKEDFEKVIEDFIPSHYSHAIRLQNLVAAVECTSKEMLPKRFQQLDNTKMVKEIQELKALLGEK